MTIRGFGPVGSSIAGGAMERDFITMSIGFSRTVDIGFTVVTSVRCSVGGCAGVWFTVVRVMSASGIVPSLCDRGSGSGDADGSGVGRTDTSGAGVTDDTRLLRLVAALFLFRDEPDLTTGVSASSCN